ncbi:hypothetical protein GCM10010305_60330 [Streptomyces termitum]|uniref:Uncharacterized protein n=1 Tax=Streptomyces termitum TaxID=67368 RepID=A0A918TAR5_9ACTN|nr:hypothetical protein GCM10010305_60330 [Streptomyces termitum]
MEENAPGIADGPVRPRSFRYEAWTTRRGKAAYELEKESVLDRLRGRETSEAECGWAPWWL